MIGHRSVRGALVCLLASSSGILAQTGSRHLLQEFSLEDTISTAINDFLTTTLGINADVDLADILPVIEYGVNVTTGSPFPSLFNQSSPLASFLALPPVQGLVSNVERGLNLPPLNLPSLQRILPDVNATRFVGLLQLLTQQPNVSTLLANGLGAARSTPLAQAINSTLPTLAQQPLSALNNASRNVLSGVNNLFATFGNDAVKAVNSLRSDFGLQPVQLPTLPRLPSLPNNLSLPSFLNLPGNLSLPNNLSLSLPDPQTNFNNSGSIPLPNNGSVELSGSIDFSNTLEALSNALDLDFGVAVTDVNDLASAFQTGGIAGFAAELDTVLAALLASVLQRASSDAGPLPNVGDLLNNLPGVSGIEDFLSSLATFNGIDDLPNVENALEKIFDPFCKKPDFHGNEKVATAFTGKQLILELVPFQCQLDDASKVLACTPAYLQLSIVPEVLTVKHKSGAKWTGLECKLKKELGKAKTKKFGGEVLQINVKKALASVFEPVASTVGSVSDTLSNTLDSTISALESGDIGSLNLPSLASLESGDIGSLGLPSLASDIAASIDRTITVTPNEPDVSLGVDVSGVPAFDPQQQAQRPFQAQQLLGGGPAPGPSSRPFFNLFNLQDGAPELPRQGSNRRG